MAIIYLYGGEEALVDDDDFDELSRYKWHKHGGGYAQRLVYTYISKGKYNKRSVLMHRHIMEPVDGLVVDHINRDRLDNRRGNLRVITQAQNVFNKGIQSNNKSGYRCIHWDINRRRWVVQVKILGKNSNLGRYKSIDDAIRVRDDFEAIHRHYHNM